MFKRITWMGVGMAVGAAGAFRAKRKVEETVERYLPEQVATRASSSAKGLSRTVRAAATEGREAMRATETELRARVDARTFVGPVPSVEPTPVGHATVPGSRRSSRAPQPRRERPGTRRQSRR